MIALIILSYSVAFGWFISERHFGDDSTGKMGVGANRIKEICALHKSEFIRQIDKRRLLIIFYVQIPFWAEGKMIPINGRIFPFLRKFSENPKTHCNHLLEILNRFRTDFEPKFHQFETKFQPILSL